ncbi:class Ib ribonucleoside-diphosphate reductase assembly flavoprotein NrdI [Fundicoccus culcitae]|uniref:Class Ib ribonucleoside-diphosphate reductase assembly flavoprotein NrdI n=1 Tax=Fundicoccus culcitae TaxID=2969821 RepID=A0ABY5P277_9LACT|nr:class Ib ribonucleoside-diphosphate reductase assembly flavoprotein NrdI [Fundicoccus culcitae]UUX32814.1 class Ib ribonucleoside-diphosphate reductase assembly flavoprotein NrdI [Fundicoccus culcitae]
MLLVYMSLTGQTRKFVKKFEWETLELTPDNAFTEIHEPYIVIAPTYEREVTDVLFDFIETANNATYLKGVAGGGNRNFNTLFCFTARDIAKAFDVPLLHEFEFQGTINDVNKLKEQVANLG